MPATVVSTFLERASQIPDNVAFRYRVNGEWQAITWTEYEQLVRRAYGGLRALGLEADDKGAIISGNRWEWHVADLAIESLGGITVPIYPTNAPSQVSYIAGHSESKVIFCENAAQLDKIKQTRADLKQLKKAIVFDATGVTSDDFVMTWDELLASGDDYIAANPTDFEEHVRAIEPTQLCTLVYTSGTTGPPKGAMLTHDNIVWTVGSLMQVLPSGPEDRRLSYLPLSHIAERQVSHFQQLFQGFETWFARPDWPMDPQGFRQDLTDCKPTVFFGVPRVWEKFYTGIMAIIENLPAEQRDMAEQAVQLGTKRVEAQRAGTSLPPDLEQKYQEADGKLFALARAALGLGEARALVSGAAPINPEVLRFFHAIGLPVAEVYGQTEDSGPTSINRPEKIKIGTVGPALPGVQVKIADDGEILVKGGNVGPGYFKDPLATKELLDDDGWMHSGDIGELDEDGYLRITDRKKDLIITAAGKNVAPQVIENMLKYSPWISQAVVIGEARPFLTAMLTLDQEKVQQFAEQKGIKAGDFGELSRHPDIQQLVHNAVEGVNADLARVEQIKKWYVLQRDFLQDEGEVTPTLKVRRKTIMDKYTDVIDELYA